VAAQGWDGIWMQVFDKAGTTTGYAIVSGWDSGQDAREAADAMEQALRKQYGEQFRSQGWKEADGGVRTLDFEGTFGPGRIEVRGEEVRAADGFPDGALERAWTKLAATKVERAPGDTWTAAASGADPLAGAAWASAKHGMGWGPVEGWTLAKEADGTAVARRGDLTARLSARDGGLQENVIPLIVELKRRYPKGVLDMTKLEELQVAGKPGARLRVDDGGEGEGVANREVYILPLDNGVLLVEFVAPRAGWDAARKGIDGCLDGLRFKD
jgi:hypothetical protein